MKVIFKNLHIVNFMSFGDSELKLNNNGFVSIYGQNNKVSDLAESNGSGKSSIWEALFWCLTGTTVRGVKDVSNHYIDDGCYVELDFDIDRDSYKIIRSKDHSKYKTNLQIFVNGDNKSGKGIRDSEKLLADYLPDLNAQLLGSVILLGQGLPQRFTNNTPAGRKEVLEKLSKSDFMIEDIKNRLASRGSELSKELRKEEDQLLSLTTRVEEANKVITSSKNELDNLTGIDDLNNILADVTSRKTACNNNYNELTNKLSELDKDIAKNREDASTFQTTLNRIVADENNELNSSTKADKDELINLQAHKRSVDSEISSMNVVKVEINGNLDDVDEASKKEYIELNDKVNACKETFNTITEEVNKLNADKNMIQFKMNNSNPAEDLTNQINELNASIASLSKEIETLKNVSDTCPTCGQKLPDVHKIDTSEKEKELEKLLKKLSTAKNKKEKAIDDFKKDCENQIQSIEAEIQNKKNSYTETKTNHDNMVTRQSELLNIINYIKYVKLVNEQNKLNELIVEKQNNINSTETSIKNKYLNKKNELTNNINELNNSYKDILDEKKVNSNYLSNCNLLMQSLNNELSNVQNSITQYNTKKETLEKLIEQNNASVTELNSNILYINNEKEITQKHQEIINKFNTVVKRDFRGYLLGNSIEFINKRAKEYCRDIFDTTDIEFKLDGNNISISYSGKEYEGLSGGERQKIDLLVQFALRDMLCTFLNFSSNILVLDEITDNLDALGCQRVINFISTRLSDVDSTYIISHRKDLDIPYDRQLAVNKNNEGISSIEFGLM